MNGALGLTRRTYWWIFQFKYTTYKHDLYQARVNKLTFNYVFKNYPIWQMYIKNIKILLIKGNEIDVLMNYIA